VTAARDCEPPVGYLVPLSGVRLGCAAFALHEPAASFAQRGLWRPWAARLRTADPRRRWRVPRSPGIPSSAVWGTTRGQTIADGSVRVRTLLSKAPTKRGGGGLQPPPAASHEVTRHQQVVGSSPTPWGQARPPTIPTNSTFRGTVCPVGLAKTEWSLSHRSLKRLRAPQRRVEVHLGLRTPDRRRRASGSSARWSFTVPSRGNVDPRLLARRPVGRDCRRTPRSSP
jgi:hypothetical protein